MFVSQSFKINMVMCIKWEYYVHLVWRCLEVYDTFTYPMVISYMSICASTGLIVIDSDMIEGSDTFVNSSVNHKSLSQTQSRSCANIQ